MIGRVRTPDLVAAAGGVALLAAMFLHWYGLALPGGPARGPVFCPPGPLDPRGGRGAPADQAPLVRNPAQPAAPAASSSGRLARVGFVPGSQVAIAARTAASGLGVTGGTTRVA